MMKKKTVAINFRLSKDVAEALEKTAINKKLNKSDLARKYIEQGLKDDGLIDNKNEIREMIRETLEEVMNPKVERLAAIGAKTGWVSSAAYFLLIKTLKLLVVKEDIPQVNAVVEQSRLLGIEFIKTKNTNIEEFLSSAQRK